MPMSTISAVASSTRGTCTNPPPATRMRATNPATNGTAPHAPPLSFMRSAPLDLSTVERRGQPTAVPEPVLKKSRPHGLQDAPTYWPTEEEWLDPFEFIGKIAPEAMQYGLCKIIPPDSWNPDFAIDTEKFHFCTRKQELNSVEGSTSPPSHPSSSSGPGEEEEPSSQEDAGTRANLAYLDGLSKFHKQHGGNNLHRLPYVDKKPLDLYRLKKAVEVRGGFESVCKQKKWAEIGRDLGYSGKIMSSLSTSLKNSFQKWLCPYEEYLRLARPGVHQQIEAEYGGPLGTPSPAPTPGGKRPAINITTPTAAARDSPARTATDALQASLNGGGSGSKEANGDVAMADVPPQSSSGFTAVNSGGGFTAVNPGGFTAVNSGFMSVNRQAAAAAAVAAAAVAASAADADVVAATPSKHSATPNISTNTPEYKPSPLGPASLKRQLSCDGTDVASKDGGDDCGSRRSKRLKKENVPTVAGSHMTLFRATGPRMPRDEGATPGEKCENCGKGDENAALITCDSCDNSYHATCLDPPLHRSAATRSDWEWSCPRCLVGDGRFGFEDGGLYSLRAFQQKAAQFKQAYFEKKMPTDPALGCVRPVTEEDVENEFWRLVGDIEETVEVEYGADIHCTTHGSGFPTAERDPRSRYSTDPWNLNILPLHGDSLFRHIKSDISGMTVPWVYVGMMFSTFCWHNEDHYSYSANYQHFGATKTWYGIPAEDAEKFEATMREAVPELFETQPDLLFQLVTLLTPEHLKKAGVRVYAADQRAGQFVITFPQAYHAGFNHGFNFNEAVNFAPRDWEPFGLAGVERLQLFRRQPCFSHDELLWTAAELGAVSISMAKWLAPALSKVSRREVSQREDFVAKHLEAAAPHKCALVDQGESDGDGDGAACRLSVVVDDADVPEEEYQCAQCKAFSFLSRFRCQASGKVLCLLHAGQHACCDAAEPLRYGGDGAHVLIYRKSDADIEATNRRVRDRARMPEAWEDKYDRLLDEESLPSLRALRSLLHEGEKIPFELPSLSVLREFVDRCNEWVEEATVYTVRKQQNRRKSEKTLGAAAAAAATAAAAAAAAAGGREQQQDGRNVENMRRLLADAEQIGFDCPEIQQLRERTVAIEDYERRVQAALETARPVDVIEDLLREGREFNVDLLQIDRLAHVLSQMRWNDDAREKRTMFLTMEEVQALVDEGQRLEIVPYNDHLKFFEDQMTNGKQWEKKAREIMAAEVVHHPQLETLSNQVRTQRLPVSKETYDAVDQILSKHREAARQVLDILDRTKDLDYRRRPKYAEVAALMKKLEDMSSKPTGMSDLEREQRRHEDWMRRGKKLFGKTNAPLHILKSHMEYVLEKNTECFDVITDKPRMPAEPCSREPSPDSKREVFCICRRTEAGLMIECEVCHEWYHSRCLKIARGKIKEEDKYTCPICDWRVKIPRDAARPKLEELQDWHEEIPSLPFQPDEEDVLDAIIENALRFRDHLTDSFSSLDATRNESETQRFYLRKIEGAEILLSYETNFFRQELHRWSPVAPEPPPVQDQSLSTRKPRPTKLQKLMAQHNATNLDDLPEDVRAKAHSLRRKQINNELSAAAAARMAAVTAATSGVTSPVYNTGYFQPPMQGSSSSQRTLSIGAHSMHSTSPSESGGEAGPPASSQSMTMPLLLHPTPTMMQTSRLVDSSGGALSGGDRLSHGEEDGVNPDADDDRRRALEIFSHTEDGRRRAVKIFGPNVWGGGGGGNDMRLQSAGSGAGTATGHDDEGDVDKMFTDLTNQEDEDEGGGSSGRRPAERKNEGEAAAAAA